MTSLGLHVVVVVLLPCGGETAGQDAARAVGDGDDGDQDVGLYSAATLRDSPPLLLPVYL